MSTGAAAPAVPTAASAAAPAGARPQYASTSLYVGDLVPDVSETTLYEFFNSVGPVASIRVCRDSSTRKSLGYAYVNYHNVSDAEKALDTLNFTPIKNKPCRIMWSQRDPAVRASGSGNLFVKNLDKSVDNRALHDTFSLFGNILSCKVVTDENGKSKGYGFVHFETQEAAENAIAGVNGMKIASKEVYVGHFRRRAERQSGKAENFTNVYCRSFPPQWKEEDLQNLFGSYGEITSLWMNSDKQGRPYACINYKDVSSAKQAVAELAGRNCNAVSGLLTTEQVNELEKKQEAASTAKAVDEVDVAKRDEEIYVLYVDRAQDKAERMQALRSRFEGGPRGSQVGRSKFEGVNLYIKNLAPEIDDQGLREMFNPFGTITSAKVMRDEGGHSKGFGFVCFTTNEEATKAISDMHLKVFGQKPLYVGLAEQKDRRHARLNAHFRGTARHPHVGPANHMGGVYGGAPNFFGSGMMPPQGIMGPWAPMGHPQMPPNMMWKPPMFGAPNIGIPGALPPNPPPSMMFPPAAYRPMPGQPGVAGRAGGVPSNMMRPSPQQAAMPGGLPPNPAMHKQVLGERLFPLVAKYQPNLAGKITGMMLDMDEEELVMLINSEVDLKNKIDEALGVLEQANMN